MKYDSLTHYNWKSLSIYETAEKSLSKVVMCMDNNCICLQFQK